MDVHLCFMRYKDTSKADAMHHHIQACQAGTQSVEQYCQQQGIRKSSYYYWCKRLSKQTVPSGFVPLGIEVHDRQSTDVIVTFPNGVSIRFKAGVKVSVLKELACCI